MTHKPTGKGERLIIINAITLDGWVPGAKVVFKSSRKTGDYQGQMNGALFRKWFIEKWLPNIPINEIIVMDNAPYHNILADSSAPTANSASGQIRLWLTQNKIPCPDDCLKVEMIEILTKIAPEPLSAIDEIAHQHGHDVIRTPPAQKELQPIETGWGVLKNEVARHCDFTMDNLQFQLEKAFEKVTATTCQKIIKKVRAIENAFWKEDAQIEQNQEKAK